MSANDVTGFDAPDYVGLVLVEGEKPLTDSEKLDIILAKMSAIEEVVNALKPQVEAGLAQVGPLVKAIEEMPLVRSLLRVKR